MRFCRSCFWLGLGLSLGLAIMLGFAAAPANASNETSGLPVPRFVSLRADEVNMRTGPGTQYPVNWVFRQRALPIEVINEYSHWRKVRDWQDDEGWVHKSMLSGRRSAVVTAEVAVMRAAARPESPIIARLEQGVVGRLVVCPAAARACRLVVETFDGWGARDDLWGVYPGETLE